MRYFLLLLLLGGAYFGWNFYQTDIVPKHADLEALEQAPHPEIDEAQAELDEFAEHHDAQATRLQQVLQEKEEAIRKYWETQMGIANQPKPAPSKPAPSEKNQPAQADARIARLMEQYDIRAAKVEELKAKLTTTTQQLAKAQTRIEEQIRQVETRLDINRIQQAEASNTKGKGFKVTDSKAELLKQQEQLPKELAQINRKGEILIQQQTEAYDKAARALGVFQSKVDRQIANIRAAVSSPVEEDRADVEMLEGDPKFQAMIKPYDEAVSHEETLTAATEKEVTTRVKILHALQNARNGDIASMRTQLEEEEQWFFTAAALAGLVLLIATAFSFGKRR